MFFCKPNPEIKIEKIAALSGFLRKAQTGGSRKRFYYGYPLLLRRISTRYSRPFFKIASLFFVEVTIEEDKESNQFILTQKEYIFNLNYAALKGADFTYDQIEALLNEAWPEELVTENISPEKSFLLLLNKLKEMTGLKEIEPLNPSFLSSNPPLVDAKEEGLYNRAILFQSEGQSFVNGVLSELEQLKNTINFESIKRTPLGILFSRDHRNSQIEQVPVLCITPLSDVQKQAIRSGMQNKLTVVTGPPGTGKSQLVLNLIANAIVNNKSVLFASKNNKAVDVVYNRLSKLITQPSALRTGSRKYGNEAYAYIEDVVKVASNDEINSSLFLDEINKSKNRYEVALKHEEEIDKLIWKRAEFEKLWIELDQKISELMNVIKPEYANIILKGSRPFFYQDFINNIKSISQTNQRYLNNKFTFYEKLQKLFSRNCLGKRLHGDFTSAIQPLRKIFELEIKDDFDYTSIESILKIIENMIELDKTLTLLDSTKKDLNDLPMLSKLRRMIEDYEDEFIIKSKEYCTYYRKKQLSQLSREEKIDINSYLKIVSKLDSSDRLGRQYYELRQEAFRLFPTVQKAIPIWSLTNLSAKRNLPLLPELFDIVVIDEASQCDIPSAVPLLFRGKQAVIIGDKYQLTHITPITESINQALAETNNVLGKDFVSFEYRTNSLFILAEETLKTSQGVILLDEHYRSHPDIINFSNKLFYENKLKVYTPFKKLVVEVEKDNPAIRWVNVKGRAFRPREGSAYNLAEIEKVMEILRSIINSNQGKQISIGIITVFRKQKEFLKSKVDSLFTDKERNDYSLAIDTAHGFQGDEKDIIIFSPVVSVGADERLIEFINKNPNLLNVAVTRAHSQLYIVGDYEYCLKNEGLLGALVNYVEEKRNISISLTEKKFESPIEEMLYEELLLHGIESNPQYDMGGFRLDLAIINEKVKIDIECDGTIYHEGYDGNLRKRDLMRDIKLKKAGWIVVRFWADEIKNNTGACVEKIKNILSEKQEQ
jgi:superfamily I DNA and/or RNA helicase